MRVFPKTAGNGFELTGIPRGVRVLRCLLLRNCIEIYFILVFPTLSCSFHFATPVFPSAEKLIPENHGVVNSHRLIAFLIAVFMTLRPLLFTTKKTYKFSWSAPQKLSRRGGSEVATLSQLTAVVTSEMIRFNHDFWFISLIIVETIILPGINLMFVSNQRHKLLIFCY